MATKSITTVETIKLEGRVVGKIMQDEGGFFYRPGTTGGLHNPKKDGEHFKTVKLVMQSLNGEEPLAMPQATGAPVKKAPAKPQRAPVAGKKPQAGPTVAPSLLKPPVEPPTSSPVATNKVQAQVIGALQQLEKQREAIPVQSKVKYKIVEQLSNVGAYFWLYAGYERTQGFKWESMAIGTFHTLDNLEAFLELNGISAVKHERVDVPYGSTYNPNSNKGG